MLTPRRAIALLLLLALTLFPVAVVVYNHMGEDCFITFRYAEQWARGEGIVYNVGDRVEGYSNFLWMALMAGVRTLGGSMLTASRWMSVAVHAALVIVFGLLAMGKPMEKEGTGIRVVPWHRLWLPLAVWAQPLLHYHCDRGLETVFFAALLGLVLAATVSRRWIVGGILTGLAALTRPEGVFYAVAFLPLAVWELDTAERHPLNALARPPARELTRRVAWFLIPVAMAWAGQMLFRWFYYDAMVANTVVAKLGRGARPHALGEIARWTLSTNGFPFLAVAGAVYGWKRLPERRRLIVGATCLLGAAVGYQLVIGRVEAVAHRYLTPALPPMLILVGVFVEATHVAWARRPIPRRIVPVLLLLLAFYTVRNGDDPRSRFHWRLWEFVRSPQWTERATWWRHEPVIINAEAGRWLRHSLKSEFPDALLAADQMGALGYFASPDQFIIDLGGLMDKEIARHGLRPEDVVRRAPDFLVLYAFLDAEEPILPELQNLVRSEPFMTTYTPWWELVPRAPLNGVKFIVYGKRSLRAPDRAERVPLGPTQEEFQRWWRVTPPPPDSLDTRTTTP